MKNKKNQIIIALDNEIDKGLKIVDTISHDAELIEKVYGVKIGSLWILEKGIDVVKSIGSVAWDDCTIILDMQKWPTDIPEIVTKQVNKIAEIGSITELIACPMGGGRKSLEAFVEATKDNGIRPICVLEMTHPESDSYLKTESWIDVLHDMATLGVDGYIIPATKQPKEEIKTYLKINFPNLYYELYCTGYKVQGGQAEPMIKFGVNKFIMGRAIYDAKYLDRAIEDVYTDINRTKQC